MSIGRTVAVLFRQTHALCMRRLYRESDECFFYIFVNGQDLHTHHISKQRKFLQVCGHSQNRKSPRCLHRQIKDVDKDLGQNKDRRLVGCCMCAY